MEERCRFLTGGTESGKRQRLKKGDPGARGYYLPPGLAGENGGTRFPGLFIKKLRGERKVGEGNSALIQTGPKEKRGN